MTILRKSISLDPGQSKTVSFQFTPTATRLHEVRVDGLAGSFIAMAGLANLSGLVTDAATGEPLSNVAVTLRPFGVAFPWSYVTGLDGRYELLELPVGMHPIMFEKFGYITYEQIVTLQRGDNQFNLSLLPVPPPIVRITDIFYVMHLYQVWWLRDSEPYIYERDAWVVAFEVHCKNDSLVSAEVKVSLKLQFTSGTWTTYPDQVVVVAPNQTAAVRFGPTSVEPYNIWRIVMTLTDTRTGAILDVANSGQDWRQPWIQYKSRVESAVYECAFCHQKFDTSAEVIAHLQQYL